MELTAVFGLLGGLLVLAFAANKLFHRTRVPDVVVLMVAGMLLGPVLGWVKPAWFEGITPIFGTLALILILFEGGLELDVRDCLHHFPGGLLLGALVYAFSLGLILLVVRLALGVSWTSALLVGAVLGCASVAVVLPVLQQIQVREPVRVTLMLEGSLGEVLAVLIVGFFLDLTYPGSPAVGDFLGRLIYEVGLSLLLAVAVGWLWSRLLLRVLAEQRFWHVLTFAVLLLLYAGAQAMGASGLIAVLGFGLALANLPGIDRKMVETTFGLEAPTEEHHEKILTFHSELSFLVRTFFFVLIGVVVNLSGMVRHLPLVLGILGALFLARLLAIQASRWAWQGIEAHERELALWLLPRGLITIVLALQVAEGRGQELAFLPATAFGIILLTNLAVIYGSVRARRHAQEVATTPAPEPAPETQD